VRCDTLRGEGGNRVEKYVAQLVKDIEHAAENVVWPYRQKGRDICDWISDEEEEDDLDLGNRLVFRFVDSYVPDDYGRVRDMFSSRGAYGRYKEFLASKGFFEKWYAYEAEAQERALREWAGENGIELT